MCTAARNIEFNTSKQLCSYCLYYLVISPVQRRPSVWISLEGSSYWVVDCNTRFYFCSVLGSIFGRLTVNTGHVSWCQVSWYILIPSGKQSCQIQRKHLHHTWSSILPTALLFPGNHWSHKPHNNTCRCFVVCNLRKKHQKWSILFISLITMSLWVQDLNQDGMGRSTTKLRLQGFLAARVHLPTCKK